MGALNGLLEEVSAASRSQQRFLANAAHQLRTPLAGLQAQDRPRTVAADELLARPRVAAASAAKVTAARLAQASTATSADRCRAKLMSPEPRRIASPPKSAVSRARLDGPLCYLRFRRKSDIEMAFTRHSSLLRACGLLWVLQWRQPQCALADCSSPAR